MGHTWKVTAEPNPLYPATDHLPSDGPKWTLGEGGYMPVCAGCDVPIDGHHYLCAGDGGTYCGKCFNTYAPKGGLAAPVL